MKIKINTEIELRKNPYKGLYVAIEGIDGSGKSTQIEDLKKYLEKQGKKVVYTSEPRKEGAIVGELIHEILLSKIKFPMEGMQFLYTAERISNHHDVIEPALKEGKIVISHRSLWSNVPYGMLDKGVVIYDSNDARVIDLVHGLLALYHQFIIPDITFYLRVSSETAIKRLQKMDKVKEIYEKKEKLEKILRGYEWQIKHYPGEFVVIDGEQDEEKVFKDIIKAMENFKK